MLTAHARLWAIFAVAPGATRAMVGEPYDTRDAADTALAQCIEAAAGVLSPLVFFELRTQLLPCRVWRGLTEGVEIWR